MKKPLIIAAVLLLCACASDQRGKEEMSDINEILEFFQALDYENGLEVVVKTFERFPLQYAATLGLDGNAQVRPSSSNTKRTACCILTLSLFTPPTKNCSPIRIFRSASAISQP